MNLLKFDLTVTSPCCYEVARHNTLDLSSIPSDYQCNRSPRLIRDKLLRSEDWGQLGLKGLVVGMIALMVILGADYGFNPALAETSSGAEYHITTTSGLAEFALARHLQKMGVKKYGAYGCPHCQEQKELLGQQAFAMIDYIECDPLRSQFPVSIM